MFTRCYWQRVVLLGLLIVLQLGGALLIPFGLGGSFSYWDYVGMAAVGWSLAPPTLLAIWAVFGDGRIAARLPAALCLLGVFCFALLYCAARNEGKPSEEAWFYLAAWPLALAIVQLPFWLARWLGRWRLTVALGDETFLGKPANGSFISGASQFSLRALLGWTVAAAVILAAWRALLPEEMSDPKFMRKHLADLAVGAPFIAAASVPLVALAWMILASGRHPWLRVTLALLVAACVAGGSALISFIAEQQPYELAMLEAGLLLNGLVTFVVLGGCGYTARCAVSSRSPAIAIS